MTQNNQNNQNTQENTMLPNNQNSTFKASNIVRLSGIIEEEFTYDHTAYSEDFFRSKVGTKRNSGVEDHIPVIIPGKWKPENSAKGKRIELEGSFRSYHKIGQDGKSHLELFAFANNIHVCDDITQLDRDLDVNYIHLEGTVYKPPLLRQTPFGRIISDLMIAVNMGYKRTFYIPCIAWGRNGYWCENLKIGDRVSIEGRMQSRVYFKAVEPNSEEGDYRETYEISIFKIDKI